MSSSIDSDVSAVVLTQGEATTERAVASVRRQTLRVQDIIVIEHVTPFHRALNLGAARTRTAFFVQVDADMILDANCVAVLKGCFADDVGLVVGMLRDPLRGRTAGVKMFRAACFQLGGFPDSISPDTDFNDAIAEGGWKTIYALRSQDIARPEWHTFGAHQPDYTPHYTFRKYLLEGMRYRYRKAYRELNGHFNKLAESDHAAAPIAQLAMAHGIFIDGQQDLLVPEHGLQEWSGVEPFLSSMERVMSGDRHLMPFIRLTPKSTFKRFYKRGIALRNEGHFVVFCRLLQRLHTSRARLAWLARIALCQGIFSSSFEPERFERDWQVIADSVAGASRRRFLAGPVSKVLSPVYHRVWQRSLQRTNASLAVFMYHGLVRSPLPLYDWCFVDATEFARQIAYLQEHFEVLPLFAALARRRERPGTRPIAVVTFDDGFQSTYDIAFPILRRAGVPATIFLVTGLVDSNATPWFCRLKLALAETSERALDWGGERYDISTPERRETVSYTIGEKLKDFSAPQLEAELLAIIAKLRGDPDCAIAADSPFRILSRAAIAEMSESGLIEFGAHTRSHVILSLLSERQAREEIESSIKEVAAWTGKPCRIFAYPNGRAQDYNAATLRILKRAGVQAAFTAMPGSNVAHTPVLELRRYGIGANLDFYRFTQQIQRIVFEHLQLTNSNRGKGR